MCDILRLRRRAFHLKELASALPVYIDHRRSRTFPITLLQVLILFVCKRRNAQTKMQSTSRKETRWQNRHSSIPKAVKYPFTWSWCQYSVVLCFFSDSDVQQFDLNFEHVKWHAQKRQSSTWTLVSKSVYDWGKVFISLTKIHFKAQCLDGWSAWIEILTYRLEIGFAKSIELSSLTYKHVEVKNMFAVQNCVVAQKNKP